MDYRLVLFCILLTSLPMLAQSQTDEFNHEWKQNGDIQFGVFGGFAENRIVYSDGNTLLHLSRSEANQNILLIITGA